MQQLRIAVQKSGRLSDKSMGLLKAAGIRISNGVGTLRTCASNFPLEILYLRDDDIPQYVEDGVADAGIVGQNVVLEKNKAISEVQSLGFGRCRMALAVRREAKYTGISWFNGKKIATSYPAILQQFLLDQTIDAGIEEISGSVEIAPGIGLADAVFDIVSTGSTLFSNGLKEVETVLRSQAILVARENMPSPQRDILERLMFRINAVKEAQQNKYILLNAPNHAIDKVAEILPGMRSPTVIPLSQDGWSSLHSVVKEDDFWEVIAQLKTAGAEGILVCPIEKMIL